MNSSAPRPTLPPKLLGLNFLASTLLILGVVRLFVLTTLEPISLIPEAAAWVCLVLGGAGMVLFWVALLQFLKARRTAG